jgi:predicted NBD/HSP70 family sugar kinase/mannose-6-phosphate isomerase class I
LIEIEGSHVTASLFNTETEQLNEDSIVRLNCDPTQSAYKILKVWTECIKNCMNANNLEEINGLGIAMPGPFNYVEGVSLIRNLNKFDSLFGVNIRQFFSHEFNLEPYRITFLNDAACFALGEYHYGTVKGKCTRGLFLTMGTGFGSTFLDNGNVISSGSNVPENGWLYHVPFKNNSIAEDFFSDKWILERYKTLTGRSYDCIKAINENEVLDEIFKELALNLADFLKYWIQLFNADSLVIGGNVTKYKSNFLNKELKLNFLKLNLNLNVKQSELLENASLLGAAYFNFKNRQSYTTPIHRLTKQSLIPILKSDIKLSSSGYEMYPNFEVSKDETFLFDYDNLVDIAIKNSSCILIDGFIGVFFDNIREQVDKRLKKLKKRALWKEMSSVFKDYYEIQNLISDFVYKDDPLFGKRCTLELIDLINQDNLSFISRPDNQNEFDLVIFIGIGASLINNNHPLIYFDLPKNEIQYRSRAKRVKNLCENKILNDSKEAYKHFYFIDWPILNSHKRMILNRIDFYVDDQHFNTPVFIRGKDLLNSLKMLTESVIRVRPWFEPGVWGGNWLKNNIYSIEKDVLNYAWSFELIAPENGLILSDSKRLIEISFDLVMFYDNEFILGKKGSEMFGYEFPIRFDFLDTFGGDNLSIQCHPNKEYANINFGENMAQDETYYILDKNENEESYVYLGFKEHIDKDEFKYRVKLSEKESVVLNVDDYIQKHQSKKHDFFSIPNGMIHGSGKNNLVLEISSTPYIFTFKIYDWLRLDLNGKPRTLNVERAFENLNFSFNGRIIQNEFVNAKVSQACDQSYEIIHLKTHEKHFYNVERIELKSKIEISTNDYFHIYMLVEGDCVLVETNRGFKKMFHYAETFIIPAKIGTYLITNHNKGVCKLLKAYLK